MALFENIQIYLMTSLIVCSVDFIAAIYAWFKPRLLKSKLCWSLIFITSLWNLSYSMEILSQGYQAKLFWCSFKLASDFSLPIILLLYILQFMEIRTIDTKTQILMVIPSATATLIIFTKMYEGIPWVEITLEAGNSYQTLNVMLGVGYQLLITYNYLILGVILLLLRVMTISPRLYSKRLSALSIVLVVPWISHLMFILGISPNNLDLTPILSNLAAFTVVWLKPESLYREDVLPAARESIVDGMLDAVLLLNHRKEVLDINPAAQRISELNKSLVLGKSICDVWPKLCQGIDFESDLSNQEFNLILDGEERIFDVTLSSIMNIFDEVSSLVVVLRDITELKHYSEQLERLVEERTNQLQNAERLATIGETATMVGHDLRNPLQVIVGYLYILKNLFEDSEENPPMTEDVLAMLDILSTQSGYMNKIVSDLQDYARPLNPQLKDVLLEDLFDRIIFAIDHGSVDISTDFKEGNLIWADTNLLRRVFTNLMTNAVQAMPDGGKLEISSSIKESTIVISVQDTGIGIPKENMSKLFKPLFTTKSKGSGFGLAVSKRLVEVHNGRIEVESEVGVGTTFSVYLPLHLGELDIANSQRVPTEELVG